MNKLNNFSGIDSNVLAKAVQTYGSPVYLYDEQFIIDKCKALLSIPSAFGLVVRYAMKANPSKSLLNIINSHGLHIDASSLNEARRAVMAGISCEDIMLTSQEVQSGADMLELQSMMQQGLKYNVCSLRQLYSVGDFAAENKISLSMRVHPGVGSGESVTRNTGDKYSCFGIHLNDIGQAMGYAKEKGITVDHLHVHIGSGGDPEVWRNNIDLELKILEQYFPQAEAISFGGGLKEARMPDEVPFDIQKVCDYAKTQIDRFYNKTGRRLKMEIEPGNYLIANAGYILTQVIDKKSTGDDGFNFIVLNGGMELNIRPLIYAARHPFYIVSQDGRMISSEFINKPDTIDFQGIIVGKCCESGDSQCLNPEGYNTPRKMAEPNIGDIVAIGGAGAYCSSMAPMNYNSHVQVSEILFTSDGGLREIRRRQTLEQIVANEL